MSERNMSRRNVVKALGVGTASVATVGGATLFASDGARAQASAEISVEDGHVESLDGTVDVLNIKPSINCYYEDVYPEVTHFGFTFTINGETRYNKAIPWGPDNEHNPGGMAPPDDASWGPHNGGVVYPGAPDGTPNYFRITQTEEYTVEEDGACETFDLDFAFQFRAVHSENPRILEGSEIEDEGEVLAESDVVTATGQLTVCNVEDDDGGGGGGGGGGGEDEAVATMGKPKVSLSVELPNGEEVSSS